MRRVTTVLGRWCNGAPESEIRPYEVERNGTLVRRRGAKEKTSEETRKGNAHRKKTKNE